MELLRAAEETANAGVPLWQIVMLGAGVLAAALFVVLVRAIRSRR